MLLASAVTASAAIPETQKRSLPPLPVDPDVFKTEEIHFKSNGKDLFGMAFFPNEGIQNGLIRKKKRPAVVMAHGFNGNPALYYELIDTLVRRGCICYFFDFAGGSFRNRSEGEFTSMSVVTEADDLENAIETVRGWKEVDKKNLFLIGESQGGFVAALTASRCPGKIKALGLMYPGFVIQDIVQRTYARKEDVPEYPDFLGRRVGRIYYTDVMDMDIYKLMPRYRKDVLIVHGDKDEIVPVEYSQRALEAYRSATLKIIEGAPHGFLKPEYSHINVRWMTDFIIGQYGSY